MLEAATAPICTYMNQKAPRRRAQSEDDTNERNATNFVDVALYTNGVPPLAGTGRGTRV